MSEFVECQNCGRTFFAENIDCPYCSGDQEERERVVAVRSAGAGGGTMFAILFHGFMLVLGGIAFLALASLPKSRLGSTRGLLGLEAALAVVTLMGLAQRRRWGRALAIAFILGNAALGLLSLLQRGQAGSLAWGPGPLALLLFLLPFLSPQARERFRR